MRNKVNDIDIKNCTYYFFDDINIKYRWKVIQKYFYYIGYMTIKDSKHIKIDSVNPSYLLFNKVNRYFEEINKNKYLTLVPTNQNKEKIKKYEELWIKIRNLIRSVSKNSDDYDKK